MPTTAIIIALVVAALLIGTLVLRSRASLPSSGPELQRMIATMADGAVTEAKQQGVTLDYSSDSVSLVEELLGRLHAQVGRHQRS